MEYALLVLAPPDNVETWLGEVQTRLLQEAGICSALALPAVLPLGYLPLTRAAGFFRGMLREIKAAVCGFPVAGLDIVLVKEPAPVMLVPPVSQAGRRSVLAAVRTSIFYQVTLNVPGPAVLQALKAGVEQVWTQEPPGTVPPVAGMCPLPLFEFGFYLGQEAGDLPEARFKDIRAALPAFHFSVFSYELIKLRVSDPPQPWYQAVFWEVIEQFKVHRARQT
jgi:hypothetical protein